MRKHLSVFMLAARSTIYKVGAVLFAMTCTECIILYNFLLEIKNGSVYSVGTVIENGKIPLVCGTAFLIMCLFLSTAGCEFSGSKLRYTLSRLSVREEILVFLWAIYNVICLFILWAVQLVIVLVFCWFYIKYMAPAYINEQTVFMAFYDNGFLHSILPLAETSRYVRNVMLILGLGVSGAYFSFKLRHDQKDISAAILSALTFISFSGSMGRFGSDVFIILVTICILANSFYGLWKEHIYEKN